jgi:hypothetical protein
MQPCTALASVVLLLLSGAAQGQDPARPPGPVDPAALEKRIAELERQVESLQKEVRALRQEAQGARRVVVVPLRRLNVEQAARALRTVYGARPGFEVATLPDVSCLMIKADEKTMEEVLHVIALVQ